MSSESSAEIASCESDDTVLLSNDSPTRKRRAEDEAGIVSVSLCLAYMLKAGHTSHC